MIDNPCLPSRLIAHRGASAYAPENTLASFELLADFNVGWAEFDVILTADGIPVVIHDQVLSRTTDGKGLMSKTPSDQLSKLDAGRWFSDQYIDERVPHLSEVLDTLARMNIRPNIELKPSLGSEDQTARTVLSTVERIWPADKPAPLYSSFNYRCLQVLRDLSCTVNIALVMNHARGWKQKAEALNCVSVNLNHRYLRADVVREIKASDRLLLAFTVNSARRAKKLFSWGVDAVFSDYPDLLL